MVNNPAAVSAVGAWAMNVFSSVGIIAVNKLVMSGYGFVFVTSLTAFHFILTSIVGALSAATGALSNKSTVPFWELAWFSVASNTSVVAMNASLMLNSVGFYQIAKLSIIPTVCVLEALINGKTYSSEIQASVVVVVLGVGICTITDVSVNAVGFITAAVAVLATSVQQIYIGSLQKKHNIGSFDLLRQTAPVQASSLILLGPFIDYLLQRRNILLYNATTPAVLFILLSCALAVVCNLSQYLCIGKFSATSFQVLGHMKTVCVLTIGWVFFNDRFTLKSLSGMLLAIAGMVMYSWAVEKAKGQQKDTAIKGQDSLEKLEDGVKEIAVTVAKSPRNLSPTKEETRSLLWSSSQEHDNK